MNKRTITKTFITMLAIYGLCISKNAIAIPNDIIHPRPCPCPPHVITKKQQMTPEKKLELMKQKLDLEYEKNKLDEEKKSLDIKSQNIKDELASIFRQIELGQDCVYLYETWQKSLDSCLEKRRAYREELKSYKLNYSDWKWRKRDFIQDVLKYGPDDDLRFGFLSIYTWLEN